MLSPPSLSKLWASRPESVDLSLVPVSRHIISRLAVGWQRGGGRPYSR